VTVDEVKAHFTDRAERYDRSSAWCTDDQLGDLVLAMTQPSPDDELLDVACGTGLVSAWFSGRVRRIVGADLTPAMSDQAAAHVDELVETVAEDLPFEDDRFDLVVCRQGIQFMDLPDAVEEMVRVTRPGGRIALLHLCAYGEEDRDEYFEVLRLRNPVRRNFFLPGDVPRLLADAGCTEVRAEPYVTTEDVDVWSDNGAIDEGRREAIREVYRNGSPRFLELHAVEQGDGRVVDHMLFEVAVGVTPPA
jgi:SAM-dependent methyltransferase